MLKASIRRRRRPTKPLPDPSAPRSGTYQEQTPELLREYMTEEPDRGNLKKAALGALVAHFLLFFVVIPTARVFPMPAAERPRATVLTKWVPPAPPARPRKTHRASTNPVPVPDPTPDEPEPIFDEVADIDLSSPDAEFVVALPAAAPGIGNGDARDHAIEIGAAGLVAPIIVEKVVPEYTATATRAGLQGNVYIEAVITVEGTVVDARLVHGLGDAQLDQRAVVAVEKWRFKPGTKDGEPVPVLATFTVTFQIH